MIPSLIYKGRNSGSERWGPLPGVTQLTYGRVGVLNPYWSYLKAPALNRYSVVLFTLKEKKKTRTKILRPSPNPLPCPSCPKDSHAKEEQSFPFLRIPRSHFLEMAVGGGTESQWWQVLCRGGAQLERLEGPKGMRRDPETPWEGHSRQDSKR